MIKNIELVLVTDSVSRYDRYIIFAFFSEVVFRRGRLRGLFGVLSLGHGSWSKVYFEEFLRSVNVKKEKKIK